eukprot:Gb_40076 [translate_table: standard]
MCKAHQGEHYREETIFDGKGDGENTPSPSEVKQKEHEVDQEKLQEVVKEHVVKDDEEQYHSLRMLVYLPWALRTQGLHGIFNEAYGHTKPPWSFVVELNSNIRLNSDCSITIVQSIEMIQGMVSMPWDNSNMQCIIDNMTTAWHLCGAPITSWQLMVVFYMHHLRGNDSRQGEGREWDRSFLNILDILVKVTWVNEAVLLSKANFETCYMSL